MVPALRLNPGIDGHHFSALPQPLEHIGLKFFDQHSSEKHLFLLFPLHGSGGVNSFACNGSFATSHDSIWRD